MSLSPIARYNLDARLRSKNLSKVTCVSTFSPEGWGNKLYTLIQFGYVIEFTILNKEPALWPTHNFVAFITWIIGEIKNQLITHLHHRLILYTDSFSIVNSTNLSHNYGVCVVSFQHLYDVDGVHGVNIGLEGCIN